MVFVVFLSIQPDLIQISLLLLFRKNSKELQTSMKILFANPTKSMQKKCKKKFNKNGTQNNAQGSSNLVQLPYYVKIIFMEQTITWDLIVTCIPLPFKMLQKGNTDLLSSRDTRMVNVTRSQNYVIVSISIQILCDYIYIWLQ